MSTNLRNIIIIAAIAIAQPLLAVSPKEMEQARTIAAQAYLRYANNGSGYLDDFQATTMEELQGKLKAKEKENLKAFNAIPVPTDYASWDKAKLIAYWSDTFFKQPGLDAEGKKAKFRVASRLKQMTVAEPTAEAPVPAAEPAQPTEAEKPSPRNEVDATLPAAAEEPAAAPEASDLEKPTKERKSSGGTGIYIACLALLVAIVVCLVVYAINSMKKGNEEGTPQRGKGKIPDQGDGAKSISESEFNEMHNRFTETLARKNEEIKELKARIASAEERAKQAAIAATSAQQEMQTARNDAEQYRLRIAELEASTANLSKEIAMLRQQAAEAPEATRAAVVPDETPATTRPAATPSTAATRRPLPDQKKVIYLGRANSRGIFIRADRQPVAGQSMFRLSTSDGMTGTYSVIDSEDTWESALLAPEEMLANACTGRNLRDTRGAVSIVTEHSGTAIFEGGCWRVARKAQISYE